MTFHSILLEMKDGTFSLVNDYMFIYLFACMNVGFFLIKTERHNLDWHLF